MIWPFNNLKKEEYKAPQLTSIRVRNYGEYTPQPDITPLEVAYLMPLFTTATWGLCVDEWIEKHNLSRHFTKVEE